MEDDLLAAMMDFEVCRGEAACVALLGAARACVLQHAPWAMHSLRAGPLAGFPADLLSGCDG